MIGTCINQKSEYPITDKLRILTSLSYICHFYTITSIKVQLNLISELLTKYINSDFSQIPLKEGTVFIDHSSTWDSIVESFNIYEKNTVDKVFFMSRPYNLLFSKKIPDSVFSLIGNEFGKYKYTVRIRGNFLTDKLGIWLRKIKLLLPLSVIMFSHFTYLSISEENRIMFTKSHLMLLEIINNRTLTYKEKYKILDNLISTFNLTD